MSLVNQMLRDLEKRRADERHGSGSAFEGLVTTAEARRGGAGVFAVIGAVVVLLGGAVGYLLWERQASVRAASARGEAMNNPAALHAAVAAPPPAAPAAQPAVPVTPGFVALEPAPEAAVPPAPVEPRPFKPVRRREPAGAVAAPTQPAPAPEGPSLMEKRPLPPTPQQRAAAAWQLGYEALGAGQREEAEGHLREALGHDPEHVPARESLAGLLLAAGRRVEAGETLETGLKLNPRVASFRKLNARLHVEQGDLAGAVATLEAGAEGAARDGDYQALLGALYQRQGAFAKSVARYQQALMLEPAQGVWWLGLAISADRGGQKGDALTAYQRAVGGGIADPLAAYANERIKALEAEAKKP